MPKETHDEPFYAHIVEKKAFKRKIKSECVALSALNDAQPRTKSAAHVPAHVSEKAMRRAVPSTRDGAASHQKDTARARTAQVSEKAARRAAPCARDGVASRQKDAARARTAPRTGEIVRIGARSKASDVPSGANARNDGRGRSAKARGAGFAFERAGSLFAQLPEAEGAILAGFDEIVQDVRPLNSKQLQELPRAIRDLSHQLTDERGSRRKGYMNSHAELAAYTRYFAWWNLYRLCAVFAALPADALSFLEDGDAVLDVGSGPLTVPIALWLARPELRRKKLSVYALDTSQGALAAGEELFLSVAARTAAASSAFSAAENSAKAEGGANAEGGESAEPWKIIRIKGEFGAGVKQKAAAVFCANMFNELLQGSARTPEEDAKKQLQTLLSYCGEQCAVFVAEPAGPRTSRFVALLRDALLRKGFEIDAPCPHGGSCAMPGLRGGKWCHFVLDGENAPQRLQKLSAEAGLPKERVSISFVAAHKGQSRPRDGRLAVRVVSDLIRLPAGKCGRYACSDLGLTLIEGDACKRQSSGDLLKLELSAQDVLRLKTDEKSGAKRLPVGGLRDLF